jgi:PAS domain S-box-containing protein
MDDENKTKEQLLLELKETRKRLSDLEKPKFNVQEFDKILRASKNGSPLKEDSILSPDVDIFDQRLSEILDITRLQSLMDIFTDLTGMVTAILDIKGNVLEATGWQDICTKYHRIHPETEKHCVESDLFLAKNLKIGEYVSYKCKNGLWDVVTPLYIFDNHVGNIYTGQFFYEDEDVDESFFKNQAEKYGFNQEEYLAALKKVPRFSREKVEKSMDFLVKLTEFISRLSYINLKLVRTIVEKETFEKSLRESEIKLKVILDGSPLPQFVIDQNHRIIHWNKSMEEYVGIKKSEVIGTKQQWRALYSEKRPCLADLLVEENINQIEEWYSGKFARSKFIDGAFEATDFFPDIRGGVWIDFIAATIQDDEGKIIGALEIFNDITERKQAEEERDRFFNLSLDMLSIADFDGYYTHLNPAWEKTLGWTREELMSKPYIEFVHPDDRESTLNAAQELTDGQSVIEFNNRYQCKNGSYRWLSWKAYPRYPEKLVYAVARDINAHKKAEKALKLSQEKYYNLFDNAEVGISLVKIDGSAMIDLNQKMADIFDSSKEEMLKDPSIFNWADPQKREVMIKELSEKGVLNDYEVQIVTKSGDIKTILTSIAIYPEEGYLQGTAVDITERKKAENDLKRSNEWLSFTQRASKSGFWDWDMKTEKLIWSHEFFELFGLPLDIEPSFDVWIDVLHPDDRELAMGRIEDAIEGHKSLISEYRAIRPDGKEIWISALGSTSYNDEGQAQRMSGICIDITNRKKDEEAIQYHENLLRETGSIAKIGGWEFDPISGKGTWSEEVVRIYDLDPEIETNAELDMSFFQGESRTKIENSVKEAIELKKHYDLELEMITAKGNHKWVRIIGQPIIENEKVVKVRGSIQDITKRKEDEKALKESELEKLKVLDILNEAQGIANIGSWDWNMETDEVWWSDETYRIFGVDSDYVPNFKANADFIHPDDLETYQEKFEESIKTGKALDLDVRILTKKGDVKDCYVPGKVFYNEFGKPIRFIGNIMDLSERKLTERELEESEEKYRTLYSSMVEGMALHKILYNSKGDAIDYIITDVNTSYERIIGAKKEDVVGSKASEAYNSKKPPYLDIYSKVVDAQEPCSFETYFPPMDKHFNISVFSPKKGHFGTIFQDITEKKKAEEALKKSEHHYRSLFENMLEGFAYCKMLFDDNGQPADWIYLEVNNAFEELTGLKNIVGKNVLEAIPGIKKTDSELFEVLGRVALTGKPETIEINIKSLEIWLNISIFSPEKEHFVAVFENVTDRKMAEAALIKSEQHFRAIVENSDAGYFFIDKDGFIRDVNRAWVRLYRYNNADEVLDQHFTVIQKLDDLEGAREFVDGIMRSDNKYLTGEFSRKCHDGTTGYHTFSARPVFHLGKVTGIEGFIIDTTERKQMEESLKHSETFLDSIIEQSPHSMWISDDKGTLIRLNQASRDMFRISDDDVVGKYNLFEDNIVEEQGNMPLVKRVFEKGQKVKFGLRYDSSQLENVALEEKTSLILDVTISPVLNENGIVNNAIIQYVDVTAQKLAEEELKRYRERLEELVKERTEMLNVKTDALEKANIQLQELDKLKSMFIASMSHELRTPLNSIIGFTGIILQGMVGDVTDEQRKQLTIVKNSANHLLGLINDVIDISRIESEKIDLFIEELDLEDIMGELKDSFKESAIKKGLKLDLHTPENIMITGDERRIKQIIMNLVSNAVKFTDDGEVEINVEKMGDIMEISVRDTGRGIMEKDMPKLFQAFSRIQVEGMPTLEGTGLGLYLSKKLATMMGGDIKVSSIFGEGSIFTFMFPLKIQGVKS